MRGGTIIDAGRQKHLEIIQQTISRLAGYSFLVKGWSLMLVSALLAIAVKDQTHFIIWIAFIPCVMFWMLDGYFLREERLYRKLWDKIRKDLSNCTEFEMDTLEMSSQVHSLSRTMISITIVMFHGTLFILLVGILIASCQA